MTEIRLLTAEDHNAVITFRWETPGIGSRLVKAAMEAPETADVDKTAPVIFPDNGSGNAFRERMGFTDRPDPVCRSREN